MTTRPTLLDILLMAIILIMIAVVTPILTVLMNHVTQLEKRTAWICKERATTIQLSNPEGGSSPLTVLPHGCDEFSTIGK